MTSGKPSKLIAFLFPLIGMVPKVKEGKDPKFEKDLITGLISLVLLAICDESEEPLYGYQIAKRLQGDEITGISLKQGTIYPVLRTMERKGLLKSKIKASESGPPRKYYQITGKGKEKLEIWKRTWIKTRTFVDNIMEGKFDE